MLRGALRTWSDDPDGERLPPLMSDAEVLEREKRLSLACERGSAAGCKKLGDVLIGKNTERARRVRGNRVERARTRRRACAARTRRKSVVSRIALENGLHARRRHRLQPSSATFCTRSTSARAFRLFVSGVSATWRGGCRRRGREIRQEPGSGGKGRNSGRRRRRESRAQSPSDSLPPLQILPGSRPAGRLRSSRSIVR